MSENAMTSNLPFGGWRCSRCGTWVAQGTNHLCGNTIPHTPAFPNVLGPDPVQVRIADALERIAAALEARSNPTGGTQHGDD